MATQTLVQPIDYVPTVFDFSPLRLSDEQFESLCRNHPDLNLEMSAEGELIIVAPTLPYTGAKNAPLAFEQLEYLWNMPCVAGDKVQVTHKACLHLHSITISGACPAVNSAEHKDMHKLQR